MLKDKVSDQDIGAAADESQQRERGLAYLKRKAAKLGFDLMPKGQTLVPIPA
jgi:hypothetical protein